MIEISKDKRKERFEEAAQLPTRARVF